MDIGCAATQRFLRRRRGTTAARKRLRRFAEHAHDACIALQRGDAMGGEPARRRACIGTMCEQQLHDLRVVARRGNEKRRFTSDRCCVDIGSLFQQQLHDLCDASG